MAFTANSAPINLADPATLKDPINVIVSSDLPHPTSLTLVTSRSLLSSHSKYFAAAFTDESSPHYTRPTALHIHVTGHPEALRILLSIYHLQSSTQNPNTITIIPPYLEHSTLHGLAHLLVSKKFDHRTNPFLRTYLQKWVDAIQAENEYAKRNPTAQDRKKRDARALFIYWAFKAEDAFRRETRFWMPRMYKEQTATGNGDTYRSGYRCHTRANKVLGREGIGEDGIGRGDVCRPFEDLPEWVGDNLWEERCNILSRLMGLIRNIYGALKTSCHFAAGYSPLGQLILEHTFVCGHESIQCDFQHFGCLSSLLMRMHLYPTDYLPTQYGLSLQLDKFSIIGIREILRTHPRPIMSEGHIDFDMVGRLEREVLPESFYGLGLDGKRAKVPVRVLDAAVKFHLQMNAVKTPEGLDWGD